MHNTKYKVIQTSLIVGLILVSFNFIEYGLPWALFVLAIFGYLEIVRRQTWHHYSLSTLMVTFLVWLFVVTQCSEILSKSLLMMAVFVGLPLTYLVATNIQGYSIIWKTVSKVLFFLGVIFGLWAIWQVYSHSGRGHAVGPLLDRNAFAALINLLWFPSTYLFLAKGSNNKEWVRVVFGVGIFVMSAALFATTSRGGIAIWVVFLPILLWSAYQHTKSKNLIGALIFICILAYLFSASFLNATIADRTFDLAQDTSTGSRLMMWESTLNMALAHPILGTGWGTWENFYPAYRSLSETASAGYYAHNDYLQFASEGGFIAFVILLAMLFRILILLKQLLKDVISDENFESITLLLGVLAVFIHAGLNFIFTFAFMNIVLGLYLARAVTLSDKLSEKKVSILNRIRPSVRKLLLGFITLIVVGPYLLHQIAVLTLYDNQYGMRIINVIAPRVTPYHVANMILAIRPKEYFSQDYLLHISEYYLSKESDIELAEDSKKKILAETILQFDQFRSQNAYQPSLGVREVNLLLQNHSLWGTKEAYVKSRQVLTENLKMNPFHVKSIILLARLTAIEGKKEPAIELLKYYGQHVITRRDQQLIMVETLRQVAAPKIIVELDEIEQQLEALRTDSEVGAVNIIENSLYDNIDMKLMKISQGI
ncbi:MAG TPA: O-antigen ligase family protein [Methylotenera sp.]|nr:O-antigen ligase family protein [Methylotenera sp.]HPH05074.1 O-antigen ligase family protein [Methylotenera sp.]HPN02330.1 O-antigen ligase family protein [Methylotenera sp.]